MADSGRVTGPVGSGQALPDPPARQGRQGEPKRCGGAATIAAEVVGSERPGLKPRAQSASPLKGAVRRTGARVDRLGGGAVGISRLQPAWGLSPAVHGRAIVETGARLIGAACRARRVGHDRLPRPWRGRARQHLAPTRLGGPAPVRRVAGSGRVIVPVGRGQAVPDALARQGRKGVAGAVGNRVSRIANAHGGALRRMPRQAVGCPGCRPAPRRPATAVAAVPHTLAAPPSWLAARPATPETIHHPRTLYG